MPQDLANSPFLLPRRRVIGIQDTATAVRVNMPWGPARPKYIPLSATKQCRHQPHRHASPLTFPPHLESNRPASVC